LLELKRQFRDGPRLVAGDCLSNRYLLIQELGSGGFATVWRALDEEKQRLVALKVLHGQYSGRDERLERFRRGARAMQELSHPNIVRILEPYREDGGYHYFAMEYVAGGTFAQAVTSGALTMEKRIGVLLEVSDALAFAHARQIVHRDVTPDNILLDGSNGRALLTDFDLVRLPDSTGGTRTGALGKFLYAAPECMESAKEVDARCDVYSVGMTAVFAVCGKTLPQKALRQWVVFIEELDCPSSLKGVLLRATEFDRDERFPTMAQFSAALREAFANSTDDLAVKSKEKWTVLHLRLPHVEAVETLPLPRKFVNSIGMTFVLIPAGTFLMGSPVSEEGREADEGPEHQVKITQPFYLGVHPVTQEQWHSVMGNNPSWFSASGGGKDQVAGLDTSDFPVERVNQEEVQTFLDRLAALAEEQENRRTYRLPGEAEWEYACRGGRGGSPFTFGSSLSAEQANFNGNHPYSGAATGPYLKRTSKVGSYPANAFGLWDMHGNVWEWCSDCYDAGYYGKSPPNDPQGPSGRADRVIRGGSWISLGSGCRSASRYGSTPGFRSSILGFRVVLVVPGWDMVRYASEAAFHAALIPPGSE
jgi:formylglycine-generating enzyme required for sulfatase activity